MQNALGSDDAAIEFATVQLSPLDKDTYLLALVLTDTGEPVVDAVSTGAVIKNLENKEDLYDNPAYYQLFWGFIQKRLEGKKRIFFAPNNLLSNIAIEYLRDGDSPFYETHEVYRLSSTKEICRRHEPSSGRLLCMFGDIDYDSETISMKKGAVSFGKLAFSRGEMEGISKAMKGRFKVHVYDGRKATEQAFLNMSDGCPYILHVSSHGAYTGDGGTGEDDAMEKSFLALSGANVSGQPDGNDGLVRASDVAKMNLRGCDLAVLSACQTGVGGLGEDGVFGLQRGFKNAGVHSLLMSLKPVYDESTAQLMVAFYEGIAGGMSKRKALVEAQKRLRADERFAKGEHWAPFILLDGVE